ncbi:MAG: SDR family oxidoreductase [Acidimicrobiales bacterium]|nr:SDR family oxidoreductase [Acidimicrobiales bacterium]
MPRQGEFAGRVALVTGGAGAGIGGAACHRLAELGADIVVVDEHPGRVESTASAVEATFGVRSLGLACDVADRAALATTVARAVEVVGPIDLLVNNAAVNVQGSVFEYDLADWDRVLAVDLTACFHLAQLVLGPMRDRGWGRIVNVSSVAAYLGGNGREPAYSVAKAGLNELTRAIAFEGGPHGIRCNAVAPGLVNSKWVEKQRDRYDTFIEATPLRRHAEPQDVANTIAFLCSDEAAHITGEIVNVSGGWYLSP